MSYQLVSESINFNSDISGDSRMYHYIKNKDVYRNVFKTGLLSLGAQLRSSDMNVRNAALERLNLYKRYLKVGEKTTEQNIINAIRRFRHHKHGEDSIYGLPELLDFKKVPSKLKNWLGKAIPVEILVHDMIRDKQLLSYQNMNATIDYSKITNGNKVFARLPHPSIIPVNGIIKPKYLKKVI